jgi:hypothetical protein
MKNIIIVILFIITTFCSIRKNNINTTEKLEIIKTDTTSDFYVFKTKGSSNKEPIILAEREKINKCRPFKKFIIADSVHQTAIIKSGSSFVYAGFYLKYIDDIQIKNNNELIKIIWNCDCFSD